MHLTPRRFVAPALLALAGAMIFPTASLASPSHASVLAAPTSVAFDLFGNVYVANSGDGHIVKFSPRAQLLTQWGKNGVGSGGFADVTGIVADAHRHVFVVDNKANRVEKFNYRGHLTGKWGGNGEFASPTSVTIDPFGHVFVADSGHNRIIEQTSAGKWITSFNGLYTPPKPPKASKTTKKGKHSKPKPAAKPLVIGRFNQPEGIAVSVVGRIYIADTGNNRVAVLSRYGRPLAVWRHGFNRPAGISVGPRNTIWVADSGNNRLVELSAKGKVLATIGSRGSGVGQLSDPRGMAFDFRGNLFVADTGNNRIEEFSAKGRTPGVWK